MLSTVHHIHISYPDSKPTHQHRSGSYLVATIQICEYVYMRALWLCMLIDFSSRFRSLRDTAEYEYAIFDFVASSACITASERTGAVTGVQAVSEGGGAEDHEATETDFERKKRLCNDERPTGTTLAYDREQQALRDALVAKGLGGDVDSSGEEGGDSGDEHGGLQVRTQVSKVRMLSFHAFCACLWTGTNFVAWVLSGVRNGGNFRRGAVRNIFLSVCCKNTWGCEQGDGHVSAAEQVDDDLKAFFSPKGDNKDSSAAFLQQYLQRRLWAQDGDDAGVLLSSTRAEAYNIHSARAQGTTRR